MNMIEVKDVTMKFRMGSTPVNSLKEYVTTTIKGTLKFNEFTALNNLSFELEKGKTLGLIGKNGAGVIGVETKTVDEILFGAVHIGQAQHGTNRFVIFRVGVDQLIVGIHINVQGLVDTLDIPAQPVQVIQTFYCNSIHVSLKPPP